MKTTLELLRERLLKDKEIFPHYNEYINGILYDIDNELLAMEKEQSLKMLPYDLDELADEHANQFMDGKDHFYGFKAGFQKALELLTFKSE